MIVEPSANTARENLVKHSSTLPKHILVGYWHNWDASPARFVPLRKVIDHFDVINVAFATASEAGDGEIIFAPCAATDPEQFQSEVAFLQGQGKRVVISIGGATGSVALKEPAAQERFCKSVVQIVRRYGFDGIDINLERKVALDPGDMDFRQPTSASLRHLAAAIRDVRSHFGPEFLLSLAPELINVQGGFRAYAGLSGSYLPVIHELRDILSYVQVQHYNADAFTGLDGGLYHPGTADFHVAMTDMLLQGFPVMGHPGQFFPPLRPEQVVVGLAAWPQAVSAGYTVPGEIRNALCYLAKGESFRGTYDLQTSTGYAALRGVMTWSVNWDAASQHQFSNAVRASLNALPE